MRLGVLVLCAVYGLLLRACIVDEEESSSFSIRFTQETIAVSVKSRSSVTLCDVHHVAEFVWAEVLGYVLYYLVGVVEQKKFFDLLFHRCVLEWEVCYVGEWSGGCSLFLVKLHHYFLALLRHLTLNARSRRWFRKMSDR